MQHSHDGHHRHGEHDDWSAELAVLERDGEISQSWLRDAIGWLISLNPSPPQRIVDVGSGPGAAALLFAAELPAARVIAFDGTQPLLHRAQERANDLGLGDRFGVRHGSIGPDLAALEPADLIWASRVIHHLSDPVEGLTHLAAAVRPGGLVAIVEGGLPMRHLPGGYGVSDAGFVSRLDATVDEWAVHRWGMSEQAFSGTQDWPVTLAAAGLEPVATRTFVLDRPAPLDDLERSHVVQRYTELVEKVGDSLSPADSAALARLVDAADPAALVNRTDLFILTANTVHVARRPQEKGRSR